MKQELDRIENAAILRTLNAFEKVNGIWRYIDENHALSYTLTQSSCSCPDFTIHNPPHKVGRVACKHFMALWGGKVAVFIVKMRQCQTLDALLLLVETEAPRIANELPEFVALANHEYHLAVGRLKNAPEQAQQQQPVAKKVKQAKFKSKSVNRNGERLTMVVKRDTPNFYNGIQIS